MSGEILFISGFLLFLILILAIDFGLFSKKDQAVSFKRAAIMSLMMALFALGFYWLLILLGDRLHNITNYQQLAQIVKDHKHQISLNPQNFEESLKIYKQNLGIEFLTGYIIEYALSVDNIFVIVLILSSFSVPEKYYHRVLFWGILGAIIMRFIFIFVGAALVYKFNWILYLFGAFLIFTGLRMFFYKDKDEKIDPENHLVVKLAAKWFAVHPHYEGRKFFHKINGKKQITPLFLVLLIIEFTDLIFAVDSIPAVFAVTKDAYLVFFSNIFAVMGLRSMFFLLVNIIPKFHYLKTGLAVLLTFIGFKMTVYEFLHFWGFITIHSLYIILSILIISIAASLIFPKKPKETP